MTRRKLTPAERRTRSLADTRVRRRWIDPQDFRALRRQSCMTRDQAAHALDVTPRTIQNWETGGARVPWMAFRMLRILNGFGLPGSAWEGWTVQGSKIISPNGFSFDAPGLEYLQSVFAQARLWRLMYAASGREPVASMVIPFPDRSQGVAEVLTTQLQRRTA